MSTDCGAAGLQIGRQATLTGGNFSVPIRHCRSEVDDVKLIERARRGDAAAFSQLFSRYQRSIYRYGAYMCGTAAADDVVQDTFLAVLRQTDRRDGPSTSAGGYLFGIARHIVMKRLGSRGAAVEVDVDDSTVESLTEVDDVTPLDVLTRAETIETVREAIRALPAERREAIVLCELQEMNYADAAGVVGCPVGTIRSRLHRAKVELTKLLTPSMGTRK